MKALGREGEKKRRGEKRDLDEGEKIEEINLMSAYKWTSIIDWKMTQC